MIDCTEEQAADMLAKGWVEIGRRQRYYRNGHPIGNRLTLANPKDTCLHPMRRCYHISACTLDKGHRGRHTTVSFECEECGKRRRGSTGYRRHEESGEYCFMCVEVGDWDGYNSGCYRRAHHPNRIRKTRKKAS